MKPLEKVMNTLAANLGYTILLVVAIVLFAVFSNGLIPGIITALSALTAYTCVVMLARAYRDTPAPKKSGKNK